MTSVRRILTTLCAFALTLLANAQVGGGNPSLIDLVRHQVDYQGNMTTTDSDYSPNIAPAIEWLESSHSVNYIVYKMGDTIHGVTTFKNYNNFGVTYTATPEGSPRLVSPAPNAIVEATNGVFTHEEYGLTYTITSGASGSLAANDGTASISWTVTGVPDHLCAGQMFLPVKLIIQDLDQEFTWRNHDELAGVSLSRMVNSPVDTMTVPWGDFAYHVGLWGWGATTQAQAHENLVYGIHYSERHYFRRFYYDAGDHVFFFDVPNQAKLFWMSDYEGQVGLIHSLAVNALTIMDCCDFAQILGFALDANGIENSCKQYEHTYRPIWGTAFSTTPVCRSGDDSTIPGNYHSVDFNFHMVVETESEFRSDASNSYKFKHDGTLHMNPIDRWSMPDYWQHITPTQYGNFVTGLCWFPHPGVFNSSVAGLNKTTTIIL